MAQNHGTSNNMYISEKEMTYDDSEVRLKTSSNPFGSKGAQPSSIMLPQRHVGNFNVHISSNLAEVTPKKRNNNGLISSTNSSLNEQNSNYPGVSGGSSSKRPGGEGLRGVTGTIGSTHSTIGGLQISS